jgi:hypothetical protein
VIATAGDTPDCLLIVRTVLQLLKAARRVTSDVDESDVRKESKATLALFQWLTNFTNFGELVV